MAASHHQPYTSCMLPLSASLEEIHDRHQRELAAMRKTHRREHWSLSVLFSAWLLFFAVIPFTNSPEQVLLVFGIFLLFYAQFVVVMLMD